MRTTCRFLRLKAACSAQLVLKDMGCLGAFNYNDGKLFIITFACSARSVTPYSLFNEVIMILDVRTMGMVSAVVPLILGFAMLAYMRERKTYTGFRHWVLANFGFCAGFLCVSLRGYIPELISVVLGNALIMYSVILIYEGIQRFYAQPPFNFWNYLVFVLYLLLQTYFTYSSPDINARVVLSSLVLCFFVLRAGSRLFQELPPKLAKISRMVGGMFFITAIFPFARAYFAFFQSEPIDFFSDRLNSWFSGIIVASILIWNFYFFFLNSARLELDHELVRRELGEIASTDPLTNLHNRRHFNEHAEMEFQRARRFGRDLSFLLIDADYFKSINDNHGHEAGDAVLVALSEILRSKVRTFDLVARLGGDEFVVMLTDADEQRAYAIAERIREKVEQTPVMFDSQPLNIYLSIGIATVRPDDEDLGTTLRRGDHALYLAKQSGRNRVQSSENE